MQAHARGVGGLVHRPQTLATPARATLAEAMQMVTECYVVSGMQNFVRNSMLQANRVPHNNHN